MNAWQGEDNPSLSIVFACIDFFVAAYATAGPIKVPLLRQNEVRRGQSGGNYPAGQGGNFLFFDRPRRAALNEILGERDVQDDDRNCHKHGAGGKDGELTVIQRIESDGDRPGGLIYEQHAREHEVRPRPYKGSERRIDDHRLGKRQRDGDKDAEIASPIQCGGIVDGARDGIEKPLLHEKSHRRTAAVQKNEPPKIVDEVQLRHDDEQRRHVHEVGEDAKNERRLHHCLAALESIARNSVSHRDDQKGRNDATDRRDEQRVAEPARIIVLCDLRKQAAEGIKAVRLREKAVQRQKIPFRIECRQHEPDARKGKDKADEQHEKIDKRRFHRLFGTDMYFLRHRYVSSFL